MRVTTEEDPPRLPRPIRARMPGTERDVTPLLTSAPLIQGNPVVRGTRAGGAVDENSLKQGVLMLVERMV